MIGGEESMAEEIGKLVVNVGLDSTGFQNGISAINRQIRVVQSEFQAAAAKLGDFGSSTESLGLKADMLSKQIDLQRQKVELLQRAFEQSAESKGTDAKATQDLQIKLNKAQAQLATLENELKSTTAQIKEQGEAIKSQSGFWNTLSQAFSKTESDIRSGLFRISDAIKGAFVFGAVYKGLDMVKQGFDAVIGGGIEFDSTMQQNQIAFTTMLGSAQKAKDLMSQITSMAAATPFETSDLTKATQTLLSFGINANQVIPIMKMLGDVSQGNKERFDSLTLAFAQIQAAGKMQGQDLLQLINAGFNPLQIISQKTGKSMAELQKEMQNGAISADMVTQAFKDATSQGGLFYNAMQNQSKTFAGQMSTLKDNLNTTFGQLMKPTFEWLTTTALPKAIEMTNKFTDALKEGGAVQAFKTIIPPGVVDTIVAVGNAIKDTIGFIKDHINEVLAFGAAFATYKTLISVIEGFKALKAALEGVKIAQLALNAVMEINPFVALASAVVGISVLIYTHWDQVKKFLSDTWNAIKSTAASVWNGIGSFFANLGTSIKNTFVKLWTDLKTGFVGLINDAVEWGKNLVEGLWNGISNMVGWIKNKVSGFAKSVGDTIKNFFGIHSPSKLMQEYGQYIAEGLALGIDLNKDKAVKSAQDMANAINDIVSKIQAVQIQMFNDANQFAPGMSQSQLNIIGIMNSNIGNSKLVNALANDKIAASVNQMIQDVYNQMAAGSGKNISSDVLMEMAKANVNAMLNGQKPTYMAGDIHVNINAPVYGVDDLKKAIHQEVVPALTKALQQPARAMG